MKITMYELLGLVKDGKAPKKIKIGNIIYELDNKKEYLIWADEIYHEVNKDYIWLNFKHINSLNDEVEILEEPQEHKIPEKIEIYNREYTEDDKYIFDKYCQEIYISKSEEIIINKINEIIDYLEVNNGIMDKKSK